MNSVEKTVSLYAGGVGSFLKTVLLSYGVLAFAPHPVPAVLILVASFFHPVIGAMGLAGNVTATLVAKWIGAHRDVWRSGVFGVNGLLVGLAVGMYAYPNLRLLTFLILGSALVGVLSVFLGVLLARNDLPILSLPFMLVIYPILLSVGMAKEDNQFFLSTHILSALDKWLFDVMPLALFEFVKAFGNILLQENLLSGVLVGIGLLLFSRISVLYGLWGALLGVITHFFLNGSLDGFHGLNYVLTALAFGGFFVVNGVNAWLIASLAVVAAGIINQAGVQVLASIGTKDGATLPPLVIAFNFITLAFLYPLKGIFAVRRDPPLVPVPLAVIKSPEANLRWHARWVSRQAAQKTILSFPFMGEWRVLQGNDGEWTHKGAGRYAWDFVVMDGSGRQYRNMGLQVKDYYAFGLPVLSPAPGYVYSTLNAVEDNPPREASTERNWGNYVVIDHGYGEFTEISHFMQNSIVVVPGQRIERGQLLGYCGNSGRSPVPHIHIQLQKASKLGSETIPAVFAEGMVGDTLEIDCNPQKGDRLKPVEIDEEAAWSMLGKESEVWEYTCRLGWRRFRERLIFTTDAYGLPAVVTKNHYLWHIKEKPNFFEVTPDYKTFPSLLSPSAWMKIVGETLHLPKKLQRGLVWSDGRVVGCDGDVWRIETGERIVAVDVSRGVILNASLVADPGFFFQLDRLSHA